MAEGFAKNHSAYSKVHEFFSAGTKQHGMNQRAVAVMSESGVDISDQYSKTLEELSDVNFDIVFAVCSDAEKNCPALPGVKIIPKKFDDPPRLTKHLNDEQLILTEYRRVRDEIREFIEDLDSYINA